MRRPRFEKYAIQFWPREQECGCTAELNIWLLGTGPRAMFSVDMELYECTACGATWTYDDANLQPSWQVRPLQMSKVAA